MTGRPTPKYLTIRSLLRARLQRDYTPGARLPPEHELCRTFGVSRITVQQALTLLEKDGLIRREQGRGTFYLGEPGQVAEGKLSGLLESLMKYREGAYARVVGKRVVAASPRLAARLGVEPESPLVSIDRVGIIDEEPVLYISAFLPEPIGAPLLTEDDELSQRKAIVSILQDKYGICIASVQQTIAARLADPVFAGHLGIEIGEPVLEVERTYLGADGRAVNFSTAFYRTDRYRFEIAMKEWR
ncbi:MAG TPA: GntR family transcriptional regulator [Candidatus Tectomicrobia bacterium]|nr:GntR family transcriptional regulator [Candidatus Tectomicrobia bacterium]